MSTEEENKVLTELRANWRLTIEGNGGKCPCCDRWGKVYRRSITSAMARSLIWLCKQPSRGDGWVHVPSTAPTWMLRSSQLPTLHLWGLVQDMNPETTKLSSSGLWQPTLKGHAFANNMATAPKYAYVYNNEVLEFEGDEVRITDCLGDAYSYESLMANFDGSPDPFDEE